MFKDATEFKYLQVLNVAGNPFAQKESDYKQRFIFNLFNLKYLDYIYIDEFQRNAVNDDDKFRDELNNHEQRKNDLLTKEKEKEKEANDLKEKKVRII